MGRVRQDFEDRAHYMTEETMAKSTLMHSRSTALLATGQKKNGMTSGIPVNPINHQYDDNYNGQQLRVQEGEKNLNHLLREHHLQKRSTCGYNLINGKENVNAGSRPGMEGRVSEYEAYYRVRPT